MTAPAGGARSSASASASASAQAIAPGDLAIDHALAQLDASFRFILDVTPVNAAGEREAFLSDGGRAPVFEYRELDVDPDVLLAELANVDVDAVEDATLGHLVRSKHRELTLQAHMLAARGTNDFRNFSIELFGALPPALIEAADRALREVPPESSESERLDAVSFLALALGEIEAYTDVDPDARMYADIREGIQGVMVSDDTLLIGPDTRVDPARAMALVHHEVGTHLVTRVNGEAQPLRLLGAGLAGYDETQEGLAVLAEIACGEFTSSRLRQLAARVTAVHALLDGASFLETVHALTDRGVPASSAFTTTMRVHRSGGFTKDAVYLRGLVDLLRHIRGGGELAALWLGKFSLSDLPLITDLAERGALVAPILIPRYLGLDGAETRLQHAADNVDHLPTLVKGFPA